MLSIVKKCLTCCGAITPQVINLKGYGKTVKNNNNNNNNNNIRIYNITYWKDISISFNLENNTFDGTGISQIGRKHYYFVLLGNIIGSIDENGIIKIEFTKYHYNINILSYIGYYNIYNKKLQLISLDNNILGELKFNTF
jgi:hypothetical protein